ncbi:hypothetical protein [Okeania sp.]|uniref:hypothetical protein n=1 Tax=Okeania sp. TaxID=3100323 RepID=UPI002B4B8587|nr:hypothetical protein [Okeania sp.]MEB3339234.1 hypothetical protein [Okeania sp.]
MNKNLVKPNSIYFPDPGKETLDRFPTWTKSLVDIYRKTNTPSFSLKDSFQDIQSMMFAAAHSYLIEGYLLAQLQLDTRFEETKGKKWNFRTYCREHYPKSWRYVQHVIKAARIGWELLCHGFKNIPSNVSQCSALASTFKKTKEGLPDIIGSWEWVIDYAKATKKKITTEIIDSLVNPNHEKKTTKVPLPWDLWNKFAEKAAIEEHNGVKLLESLVREYVESSPATTAEEIDSETKDEKKKVYRTLQTPEEYVKWEREVINRIEKANEEANDYYHYNTT